jgi:hypothetical protein
MGLLNLNPKVLIGVGFFVLLFITLLTMPQCHAAQLPLDAPYTQLSVGSTYIRGPAPVLDLTFTQPASVLRNAYWQESLTLIGSSTYIDHNNNTPAPNNFIVRGLFVDGIGRFDIGLGLAWIDNYLPYNGQHVNFALQLAYRFSHGVTLTIAHESDAGTRLPNLGRDELMLGVRVH